jgi:GAF domain-containing protein
VRAAGTVGSDDLEQEIERWPEFVRQARAEGYRAAHAAPVALRADVVGGLNLFRTQPGPLPAAEQVLVRHLATGAAIGILYHRAQRRVGTVNEQLNHALTSRIVIEQAKGLLAERHRLDLDVAFTRLRGYARSNSQPLRDVAQAEVDGTLDLQYGPPPARGGPRAEPPAREKRRALAPRQRVASSARHVAERPSILSSPQR